MNRCLLYRKTSVYPLFLPRDHRVGQHVAHVHASALRVSDRVLVYQQPTDVREEKTAGRVVRVRVCVGVHVVDPVITNPFKYAVLVRHRLERGQQHPEWHTGFVRTMRPQTVRTRGYTHSVATVHHER